MVSPGTATGTRRRGAMFLRGLGFVVAIALGGLAIWLIATSGTVKAQRVGALAGMWGVLVGAYSIFGARRHEDAAADPGTALELRQNAAIARSEDVASQREFQARLEALLRREVQEGVSRELAGLRNEVSQLRNEILEKVGGQLRMERTETTRLFGSNLEALQREVRLLKVAQLGDTGSISTIDVAAYETTFSEPVRAPEPVYVPEPVYAPEPPRPSEPGSAAFPPFRPLQPARAFSTPGSQPVPAPPEPEPYLPSAPYVSAPIAPLPPPAPAPASVADSAPFQPYVIPPATTESAPLPPYVAPDAPPAASTPSWATHLATSPPPSYAPSPEPTVPILPMNSAPLPSAPLPSAPEPAAPPPPAPAPAPVSYANDPFSDMPRIRPFTDFELDATDRPAAASWQPGSTTGDPGRHANGGNDLPSQGGRRRRADDSDNDVLAQILARERVDPPT